MLTEQGKEAARDCLSRSGLVDSTENLATTNANLINAVPPQHVPSKRQKISIDIPVDTLDKVCCLEQIFQRL